MFRHLYISGLVALVFCSTVNAQGRFNKLKPNRPIPNRNSSDENKGNQRNDFEGTVWEFKIIDRNEDNQSNKAHLSGRIRVKQSAVFAVGKVEVGQHGSANAGEVANDLMKRFDKNRDQRLEAAELTSLVAALQSGEVSVSTNQTVKANGTNKGIKRDMQELLSQRLNHAKQADNGGGARIGDLSKQSPKSCVFEFDQDDDHPLSGRAELKPDTKDKGGVWKGNYYEYVNGKKGERWHIEMRKIDE